jgi:hypothetical protein
MNTVGQFRGNFQVVKMIVIEIIKNALHVFFLRVVPDECRSGPRDWLRRRCAQTVFVLRKMEAVL